MSVLVLDILAIFQAEKMVLGNFAILFFANHCGHRALSFNERCGVDFTETQRRTLIYLKSQPEIFRIKVSSGPFLNFLLHKTLKITLSIKKIIE
jgi:hypothetical protein